MFWLAVLAGALIGTPAWADGQVDSPAKKPPVTPAAAPSSETAEPADTGDLKTSVARPGDGVIKGSNVNVRGRPTLKSEVVSQLQAGDRVNVLEEITLTKPPVGEPGKWLKIKLPKGRPVWVHSLYVDGTTRAVKATRLNLRSGPGENYSVLGRIPQGTVVNLLETKDQWLKIEPPADAYAFLAASLVDLTPVAPPPAVVAQPPPAEPPVTSPPPTETKIEDSLPTVAETQPPTEAVMPPDTTMPIPTETAPPTAVVPPPADVTMPPTETTPPPAVTTAPPTELATPPSDAPLPKRTVIREGIVKRSVSIQAPTEFALESLDTRRTINYLYSPSSNIFLLDFKGQRIQVTGEEGLDVRWPRTPVLTVETLKSVP